MELHLENLNDYELLEYLEFCLKTRKQQTLIDNGEVFLIHEAPVLDKTHKAYPFVVKYGDLFVNAICYEAAKRFHLEKSVSRWAHSGVYVEPEPQPHSPPHPNEIEIEAEE